MSSNAPPFDSTFESFLKRGLETAWLHAYCGKRTAAVKALYYLARSLDKDGQKKLAEQIAQCQSILKMETKLTIESFDKLYSEISEAVHEQEYFLRWKSAKPLHAGGRVLG